jgi:hypothetical protein
MFKLRRDKTEQNIYDHIDKLWTCHDQLANLLKDITEIMKNMTEGMKTNKEDFAHLAQQTLQIAEQQNALVSHIIRTEESKSGMESTSIH